MHRILERLDGAASTIVPLAYLAGMMVGTAAYFSGLVLDAGTAVGISLAVAIELHGFLEQRRMRALWNAYTRMPESEERDRLGGQLRAHVAILAGLVLFQAYNSLQFLSATWRPSPGIVPEPVQLVIRALVLPAAFLLSGALSPLTVEASDELRHASRQMLHRTLRATLRQWSKRIDTASRAGHDLAPVAVSLMLDAGDADGARRITLIADGLNTAEGRTTIAAAPQLTAPDDAMVAIDFDRPPTGGGSPSAAPTKGKRQRLDYIRLTPDMPRNRGVRTAHIARARLV